jgi:hypothetical protein
MDKWSSQNFFFWAVCAPFVLVYTVSKRKAKAARGFLLSAFAIQAFLLFIGIKLALLSLLLF